jgi:glycosyltransferase involved in cell wall biosynthesis
MRILFVAMIDSIHVKRWLDNITNQGWDIHLFPVDDHPLHPDICNVTVHDLVYHRSSKELNQLDPTIQLNGVYWKYLKKIRRLRGGGLLINRIVPRLQSQWPNRAWRLAQAIEQIKPDIVHSLEFQHANYLTLDAREIFLREHSTKQFPMWIVSNWGSDIYLFGRFPEHAEKIRTILGLCDYYLCECHRDVELGKQFGFKRHVLPVIPVAGGHDLERMRALREPGPRSAKRLIMLKGYHGWAGRSLVGLRALEMCADVLREGNYEIAIYLHRPEVTMAAELMSQRTGIPIKILPYGSHDDILKLHGQARISIGLSISDAISTSFLEAMIMGSFPIQSSTNCGNEWAEHGKTALFVPPEDPHIIAESIRRALTDDELVNQAVAINDRMLDEKLAYSVLQPQIVALYNNVFSEIKAYSAARD